jgi:predicted XRE-type DNA-binding protein
MMRDKMAKTTKPFSDLSDEVRKRPGAAEEIDARKRAIVAAVRLNELRKQRGQTQAQLADLLGMTLTAPLVSGSVRT